jgi:hypothetical protein
MEINGPRHSVDRTSHRFRACPSIIIPGKITRNVIHGQTLTLFFDGFGHLCRFNLRQVSHPGQTGGFQLSRLTRGYQYGGQAKQQAHLCTLSHGNAPFALKFVISLSELMGYAKAEVGIEVELRGKAEFTPDESPFP